MVDELSMNCPQGCEAGTRSEIEGSSLNVICSRCGQNIVSTTYISEFDSDMTTYTVSLGLDLGPAEIDQIRAVAEVANINFVQAKTVLSQPGHVLVQGRARRIRTTQHTLETANVPYQIDPEFPHGADAGAKSSNVHFTDHDVYRTLKSDPNGRLVLGR